MSPAAFRRVVSHGAGWIAGGGGPSMFAQAVEPVRQAWKDGGRAGEPRLVSLGYYALGPDATALAESYLTDYYAFAGDYASMVVSGAATSEAAVREQIAGFADAGCDELILFPCSPDPDQLKRLADVRRWRSRSPLGVRRTGSRRILPISVARHHVYLC